MANRSGAVKDKAAEKVAETTISASELQNSVGDVLDRAMAGERFRVTRHGRDRAIVLGVSDYERLLRLAGFEPTPVATAV